MVELKEAGDGFASSGFLGAPNDGPAYEVAAPKVAAGVGLTSSGFLGAPNDGPAYEVAAPKVAATVGLTSSGFLGAPNVGPAYPAFESEDTTGAAVTFAATTYFVVFSSFFWNSSSLSKHSSIDIGFAKVLLPNLKPPDGLD